MTERLQFPTQVRITKLQDQSGARGPQKVPPGWSRAGFAPLAPRIGQRFEVFEDASRQRRVISTSSVQAFVSEWIFMTRNSYYLLELPDELAQTEVVAAEAEMAGADNMRP